MDCWCRARRCADGCQTLDFGCHASSGELQLLQVDQLMRAEVAAELRDVDSEQAKLVELEVAAIDQLKHIEIKAPSAGRCINLPFIPWVVSSRRRRRLCRLFPREAP
jgi:hypothetical protein